MAAADLLLQNGFYNQAAARAYYAVFVLINYSANHTPSFIWPRWTNPGAGNSLKMACLPHKHAHTHAQTLYVFAGQPSLTLSKAASPRHAVKELYEQRITCDYLSGEEMGEKFAQRLVSNAKELVRVFMKMAKDCQGNPVHIVN